MDWKRVEDEPPPKDRVILAYGQPSDIEGCRFVIPGVHLAYWDQIDSSFCLKGATWMGPFIEPTHWAEEPEPPYPTNRERMNERDGRESRRGDMVSAHRKQ